MNRKTCPNPDPCCGCTDRCAFDLKEDIKFYKPDKNTTTNSRLIKKAFREGFKQGIAFMNESDSMKDDFWRQKAFRKFCNDNKVKV